MIDSFWRYSGIALEYRAGLDINLNKVVGLQRNLVLLGIESPRLVSTR